jgi:hypothetical protein
VTVALTILLAHPDDADTFTVEVDDVLVPLLARLPGAGPLAWGEVLGDPDGRPADVYAIGHVPFDDAAALGAAWASPAGRALARWLADVAPGGSEAVVLAVLPT